MYVFCPLWSQNLVFFLSPEWPRKIDFKLATSCRERALADIGDIRIYTTTTIRPAFFAIPSMHGAPWRHGHRLVIWWMAAGALTKCARRRLSTISERLISGRRRCCSVFTPVLPTTTDRLGRYPVVGPSFAVHDDWGPDFYWRQNRTTRNADIQPMTRDPHVRRLPKAEYI